MRSVPARRRTPYVCAALLLVSGAALTAQTTAMESFGPLVLPLKALEGSAIRISTDLGVLAPDYQKFARDDPRLVKHFAGGSAASEESFRKLAERTGMGHAAPYIYAAVYHTLGRIYYGISSAPRLADGSELAPKRPFQSGTVHVRVFGDAKRFAQAAKLVAGASAEAYWNPKAREVGLLTPREMFRWVSFQQTWQFPAENAIAGLEVYVTRVVMRAAAHELFHAVQQHTATEAYDLFPLLNEGTAEFIKHNTCDREELVRLSESQVAANASRPAEAMQDVTSCIDAVIKLRSPRYGYWGIMALRDAAEFVEARPSFSLTGLLAAGDRFYVGERQEILGRYAIAFAAVDFLRTLPKEPLAAWNRVLQEILKDGAIRRSAAEAGDIDSRFRARLEVLARRWWRHPEAASRFVEARALCTKCLLAITLAPARQAALAMAALNPESATAPLYIGDVFYKVRRPYIALDYYRLADQRLVERMAANRLPDESPVRVRARLGDALELMGDIAMALRYFRQVGDVPPEKDPLFATTIATSLLKLAYYEATRASVPWNTEESLQRLKHYLWLLQNSPENAARRKDCLARNDAPCLIEAVFDRYGEVLAAMQEELKR